MHNVRYTLKCEIIMIDLLTSLFYVMIHTRCVETAQIALGASGVRAHCVILAFNQYCRSLNACCVERVGTDMSYSHQLSSSSKLSERLTAHRLRDLAGLIIRSGYPETTSSIVQPLLEIVRASLCINTVQWLQVVV